jgi:hypothetical protein
MAKKRLFENPGESMASHEFMTLALLKGGNHVFMAQGWRPSKIEKKCLKNPMHEKGPFSLP